MAILNEGGNFTVTTTHANTDLSAVGNRALFVFANFGDAPALLSFTANNGLELNPQAEVGLSSAHLDEFANGIVLEGGSATRVILQATAVDSTDTNNTITITAAPVHARPLATIEFIEQSDLATAGV